MQLYFAPMQGVTPWWYRGLHHQTFGGVDRYFTPFITPVEQGLAGKSLREVCPEHNGGLPVVPQVLTNKVDGFLRVCNALAELGYTEVNLNLGCPSGTVVSKGRGAGFLQYPDELNRFLNNIYAVAPIGVSIKTRLGMQSAAEFAALLDIYNQYPVAELIVHARVRADFYKGVPNQDAFAAAAGQKYIPVCYNGNLFTVRDAAAFVQRFPAVERLMLGRGLVANPALARQLKGGAPLCKAELRRYHDAVLDKARSVFPGEKDVLYHMKEQWYYWGTLFAGAEKFQKAIRKAKRLPEFTAAAATLFANCDLRDNAGFCPPQ